MFHTYDIQSYDPTDAIKPLVEFKQKFQLASRTSRYKNQLAPPDILLARPSITKNYIMTKPTTIRFQTG
jgi:hypothetical protein